MAVLNLFFLAGIWAGGSRPAQRHQWHRLMRRFGSMQWLLGGAVVLGLLASVAGDLTAEDLVYSDAWGTQSACSGCSYIKGHVVEKPQEEVLQIDCICPPQVLPRPPPVLPTSLPCERAPSALALFLDLCPQKLLGVCVDAPWQLSACLPDSPALAPANAHERWLCLCLAVRLVVELAMCQKPLLLRERLRLRRPVANISQKSSTQ